MIVREHSSVRESVFLQQNCTYEYLCSCGMIRSTMARRKDKEKAIALRKKGLSYAQIRDKLGVSKSTLSYWLRDYPLSKQQMRKLRDLNPVRIEKYRNTRKKQRESELKEYQAKAEKKIKSLNKREKFIAGLFLYWAEGWKTERYRVALGNTDPAMIKFFIQWLELLGVSKNDIKIYLHLYADMDIKKESQYWSKKLDIPLSQFRKPYVKKSKQTGLTYKSGHSHGTCNVIYHSKEQAYLVHMGLKYLQGLYE